MKKIVIKIVICICIIGFICATIFSLVKFLLISASVANLADPYSLLLLILCFEIIGSIYIKPTINKININNKKMRDKLIVYPSLIYCYNS